MKIRPDEYLKHVFIEYSVVYLVYFVSRGFDWFLT